MSQSLTLLSCCCLVWHSFATVMPLRVVFRVTQFVTQIHGSARTFLVLKKNLTKRKKKKAKTITTTIFDINAEICAFANV